jgi:hypothetical protein
VSSLLICFVSYYDGSVVLGFCLSCLRIALSFLSCIFFLSYDSFPLPSDSLSCLMVALLSYDWFALPYDVALLFVLRYFVLSHNFVVLPLIILSGLIIALLTYGFVFSYDCKVLSYFFVFSCFMIVWS